MTEHNNKNVQRGSSANERAGAVILNAASSYVRFAVMMAGMFLLTPFMIEHIGCDDYGLWMLAMCVVGCFELLDCGFATATVKYVGQYRGAGDVERRNRLASTLLSVYVCMAAAIAILAGVLTMLFGGLFNIAEAQQGKAIAVLFLLSAKVALNLPLSLFLGVMFGQQRIFAVNLIRITAYLVYAITVWFALTCGHGVIMLALLNAVVFIAEHAMFMIVCRWRHPDLKLSWRSFDVQVFRQAASFSAFALITNVAAVVLLRTDPIVVKFFLPLSAVALYALALKIAEQVLLLTKQFINVFTPLVAELHGAGDRAGVRAALLSSTKFGLATLLLISMPLMYFATDALVLWVGPSFRACGPVLALLIAAMHFKVLHEGATNVLGMTGEHRYVAATSIAGALLNVALSVALIVPLGLPGVALATLISTAIIGTVVVCKIRADYRIGSVEYWRRVVGAVLLPSALQLCVCAALRMWRTPESLLELAAYAALAAATFAASFLCLSLDEKELAYLEHKLPWLRRLIRRREAGPSTVGAK